MTADLGQEGDRITIGGSRVSCRIRSKPLIFRTETLSTIVMVLAGIQGAMAQNWLDTRAQIEELSASLELEAAAALGPQFIEQISSEFGVSSRPLAEAHMIVARVQQSAGEYDRAETNALAAIEIFKTTDGEAAPGLIEPLTTLGDIYQLAGRHGYALSSFAEARDVSRRNDGLLNQQQLPLVDRMTQSAIALGDYEQGLKLQREARNIVARYYGEDSREYHDANDHYLGWLGRLDAGREHARAVFAMKRLLKEHHDNDPKLRIELLQTAASIFRNNPNAMLDSSRIYPQELELALKLHKDLAEPDPALKAKLQRDLGDWYSAFNRSRDAERYYLKALAYLDDIEGGEDLREEWFGSLVAIRSAPLSSWILSPSPNAPSGHVELAFIVNSNGRPQDVRVIDSSPAGLMDGAAVRQIAQSVFRPTLIDGRIAASPASFTWQYRYDPLALDRLGIRLEPGD